MHWQTKKNSCDAFYCDICCTAVVWNWTHSISKVCLNGVHNLQKKAMLRDAEKLVQGRKASDGRIKIQNLVWFQSPWLLTTLYNWLPFSGPEYQLPSSVHRSDMETPQSQGPPMSSLCILAYLSIRENTTRLQQVERMPADGFSSTVSLRTHTTWRFSTSHDQRSLCIIHPPPGF